MYNYILVFKGKILTIKDAPKEEDAFLHFPRYNERIKTFFTKEDENDRFRYAE